MAFFRQSELVRGSGRRGRDLLRILVGALRLALRGCSSTLVPSSPELGMAFGGVHGVPCSLGDPSDPTEICRCPVPGCLMSCAPRSSSIPGAFYFATTCKNISIRDTALGRPVLSTWRPRPWLRNHPVKPLQPFVLPLTHRASALVMQHRGHTSSDVFRRYLADAARHRPRASSVRNYGKRGCSEPCRHPHRMSAPTANNRDSLHRWARTADLDAGLSKTTIFSDRNRHCGNRQASRRCPEYGGWQHGSLTKRKPDGTEGPQESPEPRCIPSPP